MIYALVAASKYRQYLSYSLSPCSLITEMFESLWFIDWRSEIPDLFFPFFGFLVVYS